jgi:hypothetical protein
MVNPVGLLYGPLNVEFGFGLGPQASLVLSGARWQEVPRASGSSAWSVSAGAQLFASGPLYEGVYATPSVGMMWIETDGSDSTFNAWLPQLVFGYQWDWKMLSLRLGLGGYYLVPRAQSDAEGETVSADFGGEGLGLALDLAFGLTF